MRRILIIGHARHGKDTVAEILRDLYGYSFQSSSVAAARIFLYDALRGKYGYETPEQCFEDRVNRRKEWHDLICQYNREDKARLAKEIMRTSWIYVGMRSNAECEACIEQGVFDLVIGVYNPNKPLEGVDSFDIDVWAKSDIVVPNSGTKEDLMNRLLKLKHLLV